MARQQKVRAEGIAPIERPANEVLLRLGRLIGRQMAREAFGLMQQRVDGRRKSKRRKEGVTRKLHVEFLSTQENSALVDLDRR